MQEQILFFFQLHSNPIGDILFEMFTLFGEDLLIIALLAWVYWNYCKKKGFVLTFTLLFSVVLNNFLKIIFRRPRPYEVYSDLKGKRLHTATGYSFPSGHTQASATFYTSLSLLFRYNAIAIISFLIIMAVALSRVYLGLHWPVDVLASLLLGGGISLVLVHYLITIEDNFSKKLKFIIVVNIVALLALAAALLVKILVLKNELKTDDLIKTIALLNGVSLGFVLDFKNESFIVESKVSMKIIRYLIGMAGAFVLINLFKIFLPDLGHFNYMRYFILGFWVVYLYPSIGVKLSLFQGANHNSSGYIS